MNNKTKRNNYIDIVKAIGIISIVIGHSSWTITNYNIKIAPFVYSFHLMIFMFVSGFLFNTEKANEDKNYKYYDFGKQLIKFAKMFVIYSFLFSTLHNAFLSLNIISGENYDIDLIIKNTLNSFTFNISEVLLCAFWFVPTLLIAKALFVISYTEKNITKLYRLILVVVMFSIAGIILCQKNVSLDYRMQISVLSVPFIYAGVLAKKYWNFIEKIIAPWTWIISMIIIIVVLQLTNSNIELSINQLLNPYLFYPLSLVGIHFCLSLAKMIDKINYINFGMALIGKFSFHIMAMHFLVIKVMDVIYSKINGINDVVLISHFPYSYSKKLFIFYYIFATIIPVLIMILADKIINKIKKLRS